MPWYRSSVFSRTITRSTPSCRVGTPGRDRAGRIAANRSRSCRSATLTLRNPVPTGVVIGPLIATRQSRIASSVCSGSSAPSRLERAGARRHLDPLDPHVGGVEDQSRRRRDLGADPVAGDENDPVCHRSSTLPGRSAVAPTSRARDKVQGCSSSARRRRSRCAPSSPVLPRPRTIHGRGPGAQAAMDAMLILGGGSHRVQVLTQLCADPVRIRRCVPVPPVAAARDRRRRRSADHVGRRAPRARAGVLGVRARRLRRRLGVGVARLAGSGRVRVPRRARRCGLRATTARGARGGHRRGKAARRPRSARTGSRASLPGSPS